MSSNFPVEILSYLQRHSCTPEKPGCLYRRSGAGTRMCEVAESEGYSNDICAYACVSPGLRQAEILSRAGRAMPDVLCCSNICSCMIMV